jgi:hypothetical protein
MNTQQASSGITFEEFVSNSGIAISYAKAFFNSETNELTNCIRTQWQILMSRSARKSKLTTFGFYHTQPAGEAVDLFQVLQDLALKFAALEASGDFESWAAALGYKPNDSEAKRIYLFNLDMRDRFVRFIGEEGYLRFVFDTGEDL